MLVDISPEWTGFVIMMFFLTGIMAVYGVFWIFKRLLMKCGLIKNNKDNTEDDNVGPKD